VPPLFGVGVLYPYFLRAATAVGRLLQHFADSLDRFAEEKRVKKGAREEVWRRQGRGGRYGTPTF